VVSQGSGEDGQLIGSACSGVQEEHILPPKADDGPAGMIGRVGGRADAHRQPDLLGKLGQLGNRTVGVHFRHLYGRGFHITGFKFLVISADDSRETT